MEKKIAEALEGAERILIGIGEEFSLQGWKWEGPECLEDLYRSKCCAEVSADHEIIRAYRQLRELIGDRSYFAVTLNTDDLIYQAGFERECVVAPCGSAAKLQCEEHIVDGHDLIASVFAQYEKATELERAKRDLAKSDLEQIAESIREKTLICPECGKKLDLHTVENDAYLECGYLEQWEAYKKWLATTLNKKLCILELGVGFRYPQVIRWPFEKTAFYNKKATLVRIHSKFPQIESELADKAIGVKASPIEILLNEMQEMSFSDSKEDSEE